MHRLLAVALACVALASCGHRDRAPVAKNVVNADQAKSTKGMSRAEVTKLLGTPFYGDDLEWHYYSTDPATGREFTCFIYFKPDTGLVRDAACLGASGT
jgi:outer membrane protein assembly factor BamE (lipoprotein component of BamABCDE complex)